MPGSGQRVQKLHDLLEEHLVPPLLDLAREHGLPVVDLLQSFDIHDKDLYAQTAPQTPASVVDFELLKMLRSVLQGVSSSPWTYTTRISARTEPFF